MKKVFFLLLCMLITVSAFSQSYKKYGVKCGIVKTVTDASGRKSYNTTWFDHYGALEKTIVTMDMGGGMGVSEWVTISLEDGNSYMLDATRKQVTVTKRVDVNYLDMPADIAKARQAKQIGEETLDGRKCVKWEEHVKQILHTATMVSWVWEGIPVKYTINNPKSETTLIEFEQKKSFSDEMFAIPADYKVRKL